MAGLRANLLCIRTRFHGNAFELSRRRRRRRRCHIICFISGFGRAQLGIKCLCIGSVHHFNAHFRIFQCFRKCLGNIIIVNVENHLSSYVRWCCSAFRLIVSLVSFSFFSICLCFDCVLQFVKGPKYNLYWLGHFWALLAIIQAAPNTWPHFDTRLFLNLMPLCLIPKKYIINVIL